jgi:hypothetical protein
MPWPAAVAARLASDYPGREQDAREILLGSLGDRPPGASDERVLLAVLHLADRDLMRLAHYASAARADFRDVIFWASTPREPDEPASYSELRRRLGLPPDEHTGEPHAGL